MTKCEDNKHGLSRSCFSVAMQTPLGNRQHRLPTRGHLQLRQRFHRHLSRGEDADSVRQFNAPLHGVRYQHVGIFRTLWRAKRVEREKKEREESGQYGGGCSVPVRRDLRDLRTN